MNSKNNPLRLKKNEQNKNSSKGQSSDGAEFEQGSTISLVYPDGRVTNVKISQKQ